MVQDEELFWRLLVTWVHGDLGMSTPFCVPVSLSNVFHFDLLMLTFRYFQGMHDREELIDSPRVFHWVLVLFVFHAFLFLSFWLVDVPQGPTIGEL